MQTRARVVVVGAGISGLAAAWRLTRTRPGTDVIVLDGAPQVGGKLRLGRVGGLAVDVGAESVLARRPEALALMAELGLAGAIVHPTSARAAVLARGRLHPLPAGTVMGVPGPQSLPSLAGLLTDAEIARVRAEPAIDAPALTEDVDVGSWVAGRMGRAVVDRLVEPLLGGVYAGRADRLSLQATVPALWDRARRGGALLSPAGSVPESASDREVSAEAGLGSVPGSPSGPEVSAEARLGSVPGSPSDRGVSAETGLGSVTASPAGGPVFAGLDGGLGRLPAVLAARLADAGVEIRPRTTVRGLRRTPTGWRLETGPAPAPAFLDADAVILAVPPAAAARLLAPDVPAAAAELAGIESASVAVVALALPREQVGGVTGSGVLVPPVEGVAIKAATFSSAKWAWVSRPDEPVAIRVSLGRAREEATLQRTDDELVALAVGDLSAILGRALRPLEAGVTRWGGGLPQYAVGHVARVARVRAAVAATGGLAICGAALDGVGVAPCVAAADRAVADLRAATPDAGGRIAV